MDFDDAKIRTLITLIEEGHQGEVERLDLELKPIQPLTFDNQYGVGISKSIAALSNYGGGVLVVGYRQSESMKYVEQEVDKTRLKEWDQTRLNKIIKKYFYPIPEFRIELRRGKNWEHPWIFVSPIRGIPSVCIRNGNKLTKGIVYTRTPGPESEAAVMESDWNKIIHQCTLHHREEIKSLIYRILEPIEITQINNEVDDFRRLVNEADERYSTILDNKGLGYMELDYGHWTIAYQLLPKPDSFDLHDLKGILFKSQDLNRGWPIGFFSNHDEQEPHTYKNTIEAQIMMGNDIPHLYFWKANPSGFYYNKRIFGEDVGSFPNVPQDRSVLEYHMPIINVSQGLLHATRVSSGYDQHGQSIRFFVRYGNLNGRYLWNADQMMPIPIDNYQSRENNFESYVEIPMPIIKDDLPELVKEILAPMYIFFNFYELSLSLCHNIIKNYYR